jgi:hypothetical protein
MTKEMGDSEDRKVEARTHEPRAPRESSPKHKGYGTDMIGGGGQREFSGGVRELEAQAKEFHHKVADGGMPLSNKGHEEHVRGHKESHYRRRG